MPPRYASKQKGGKVKVPPPPPPCKWEADLKKPLPLPEYAAHYLFKCGRLTMASDPKRKKGVEVISLIGVDTFTLKDAINSGQYIDEDSFGDFEARALRGWHPSVNSGDSHHMSFVGALAEAKTNIRSNVANHDQIAINSQEVRRASVELAGMHARDSELLDNLKAGYAPGQRYTPPKKDRPVATSASQPHLKTANRPASSGSSRPNSAATASTKALSRPTSAASSHGGAYAAPQEEVVTPTKKAKAGGGRSKQRPKSAPAVGRSAPPPMVAT